tara:strand:+ start:512 stop:1588 length:1077 start_codon:yes stop_codon:yes gene_type:complete
MNPIIAFIKLIRLPNLLIIALAQYAIRYGIFYPIIYNFSGGQDISGVGLQMSNLDFFLLSLSTVMIAAAGYIINDYFDVKIDRVNRSESIIVGKHIKRRVAMGAHIVINGFAILIGAYLAYKMGNWKLIFIQVVSAGALWYYSTTFKRQVIVGNVVVALLAALVPFVAGLYELILQHLMVDDTVNMLLFRLEKFTPFEDVEYALVETLNNILLWVSGFALFAFISTLVREIVKDIEDCDGDEQYESNTLPVVYGKSVAKMVAQVIALIMLGLIGYYQYMQVQNNAGGDSQEAVRAQTRALITVMYFLFTVQLPLAYVIFQIYTAKVKEDYHKISTVLKLIMLAGISYAAVFYFLIIKL